ncbi:YnbE family lipoprotein [Acinetobacter baumannii]
MIRWSWTRRSGEARLAMAVVGMAAMGGCVSVSAPDKPIVINLNIKISAEVVVKLDGQAKQVIQGNPDIF